MSVELKKIDIKIGDKTVSLTPEQAKELRAVLNETFPDVQYIPAVPIVIEKHIYPWEQPRPYWQDWTITCQSDSVATFSLNT